MFWVFIISVCFWLLSRFQIFFLAQVHIIVQSYMLTCVMTQGNSGFTGADHSGRWYHVYLNPSLGDSYMLVFKKAPAKITMIFYSILQPSVYVVSVYYFFSVKGIICCGRTKTCACLMWALNFLVAWESINCLPTEYIALVFEAASVSLLEDFLCPLLLKYICSWLSWTTNQLLNQDTETYYQLWVLGLSYACPTRSYNVI